MLASDAAKTSQRVDLENHIKTVSTTLEKTNAQLTAAKTQLDQVSVHVFHSRQLVSADHSHCTSNHQFINAPLSQNVPQHVTIYDTQLCVGLLVSSDSASV